MDLINREQALGCFWNYANDDGTGYDETDMPAYDRLQALPIVADVEDCISRQDAIDALDRIGSLDTEADKKYARSVFEALPSAQPVARDINVPIIEPRNGKWIKISPANIYECSVCGQSVMTNDIETYKFCHGCGADMRGEEDESN